MPEHRIALRRAWEHSRDGTAGRVDLPAVWVMGEVPTHLSRRFQRPRRLDEGETLWLELSSVEGLRKAFLNSVDLGRIPPRTHWECPFEDQEALRFQLT